MGLIYKLYRLRVKMRRFKEKDLDLDDVQQKAYDITVQLIHDKESNLICDTAKGRRAVTKKGVFVEIGRTKLIIINGIYHYDVPIDDRIRESLIFKFESKLTRKFNIIESQVLSKVKNTLDSIKEHISEYPPENTEEPESKTPPEESQEDKKSKSKK